MTTLMAEKYIHTLLDVDGGKFVGIMGKHDVIRSMA